MNDDNQPLKPRTPGEFLVRRKRRRLGPATDPGLNFYVPSSPTSVDANPSSETAEPRSASSDDHDVSQRHSPMNVDDQPLPQTPRKPSSSLTPTPMLAVGGFLRTGAGGSRKRQKLGHVDLGNTLHETSPTSHPTEERHPPTIKQPLTSTAPRRKRKNRSRFPRAKVIPVKGKAYRTRSQKPKAVMEDLVRTALATHVDVDEDFLEGEGQPQSRLDLRMQTDDLAQNTPATARRRNFVHPSKTQPFLRKPSLGNTLAGMELGRHPRKPMTSWEGALALSKLDIQMPASTSTPRRKGRPIQGSPSSRARGRYPKLPLTQLSPTPKPSSRGHPVPRSRPHLQRGPPGQNTHPEVAAMLMLSAEEITSPNSEPGSEHGFGSSTLGPLIRSPNIDRPEPSRRGRAKAAGSAVTYPFGSEPQANSDWRRVRFSSPLVPDPDPDDEPDDHPIVLVPNSSDPNLASRVNPNPSNHAFQNSPPPPLPSPRLLFIRSGPHSLERTLGYRTSAVDSDVERDPGGTDAFVPPITVSTESRTSDDNGKVASGGLILNDVKNFEGLEEAENVDQNQPEADSRFGSQDPDETPVGKVQDSIDPQDVHPNNTKNAWEPDMQQGNGDPPDRIENSKRVEPLMSSFDRLTVNARRVEPEARSKLQAEVEGDEEDTEAIGTPKEAINSNGPPRFTSFPPLGRMLSLLDEAEPSRSLGGFGGAITRRPRRPIAGRRFGKPFQTQPAVEVESGWRSEGTCSNVHARSEAGVSKSDDLSYFAGL